jgi:hypothetical protein
LAPRDDFSSLSLPLGIWVDVLILLTTGVLFALGASGLVFEPGLAARPGERVSTTKNST